MNTENISPDDPRLTLFALHEMEPAEQAEFEKLLQSDAAARQAVDEIRATVATITAALEHEPAFTPASTGKPVVKPAGKLLRFPQLYFVVSGLAAACFAMFFVIWQSDYQAKQRKQLVEANRRNVQEAKEKRANELAARSAERVFAIDLPVAPSPAPMQIADAFKDNRQQYVGGPGSLARAAKAGPAAPVTLSPFVVRDGASGSIGATSTLAGTRVTTDSDSGYLGAGRSRQNFNTEAYALRKDNAYLRVADQPLSTFSVDVDTASYANVRRMLLAGQRPPADAVRIEELVNYFPYNYAGPESAVGRVPSPANDLNSRGEGTPPTSNTAPFAASLEVASAPWAPEHRLVRIGLKGREVSDAARPAANLVFLLDVSGSMHEPNKLPLVQQSMRLLIEKLRPDDRVAIAVYAGASGLALPSTKLAGNKAEILDAIDRLQAGGSTNGAAGIHLAYDVAKANFIPGGVNRVILATDGDFNVGVTSEGELVRLVEEKAKSGVFLSVLGYGMGNIKDSTLEQLADKGNGNYAYIDSLAEAKKTLVEQAGGTLVTIAKDVKLQVEFNPALVAAYRLIGYENRLLAKEDFNNDQVDAGEIGSGHTVTALYEIVPVGAEVPGETPAVDALKYQRTEDRGQKTGNKAELLTVKIRYKEPAGDTSSKLEFPLRDTGAVFANASQDFKFAAAVAAFGMVLRDSPHKGAATMTDVVTWGRAGLGSDAGGYRSEFLGLAERAQTLLQ